MVAGEHARGKEVERDQFRAGNYGSAIRRRVQRGDGPKDGSREPVPQPQQPPMQRRNRKKTGKRSNREYTMTGAYVRREVYDLAKQALLDPEVKRGSLAELEELGVNHQPEKVVYSDLVEKLLLEWLEEVGYSTEEGT